MMLVCALVVYFASPGLMALPLIFIPFGLLPALLSLGDPRKAKAFRALRERYRDIVWIYEEARYGDEIYFVVLALVDGERIQFPAEAKRVKEVMAALATLAPGAAFGFTAANEDAFIRNPASLRQGGAS